MLQVRNDEWMVTNHKKLRHPNNKQFVTGRANIMNGRKVISVSIGVEVCDLIEFNKNDRVNVFINKYDRNLLIIKKDENTNSDGYKLNHSKPNNSFMNFQFRYESPESYRLSQTVILDYDLSDIGTLLIDISKLKWSK